MLPNSLSHAVHSILASDVDIHSIIIFVEYAYSSRNDIVSVALKPLKDSQECIASV